jgi:hypothetical protein
LRSIPAAGGDAFDAAEASPGEEAVWVGATTDGGAVVAVAATSTELAGDD